MSDREILLDVIGANRNGWMMSFGYASHHIAKAVVDGRISEDDIERFVPYHAEDCIALAQRAGIYPGNLAGAEYHADAEDVSISVEAIRDLVKQPFVPESGSWYLVAELRDDGGMDIDGVPTSFEQLNAARSRIVTYAEAAKVLLDADARFSSGVRA